MLQRCVVVLAVGVLSAATVAASAAPGRSLVERLGYPAGTKVLIINGDDTGMCHAANVATFDALTNGVMTSATIMVPCPWFLATARFAKENPKADLGVHLTHTAEWQVYRWGPLTDRKQVPGLVDPDGYLWRSVENVYRHGTVAQALTEARAQVKRALAAGIDVTHIDSHMGAMQYNINYHRAYLKLARELDLPVRMGSPETYVRAGFPSIRAEAKALGLVFPDRLVHEENPRPGQSRKDFWLEIIRGLKPEVTELYIHASVADDEARAIAGSWRERAEDYELFTKDPDVRAAVKSGKVVLIGYRPLRDLQRKERAAAKKR